jgi:hypothetical protein
MAKINFENCLMRLKEEEERLAAEDGIIDCLTRNFKE